MNTFKPANKSVHPVGFAHGHIGTATKIREYEDRHFFGTITNSSGVQFTLAIVADGVGGGNLGQRAAQFTVDTIVSYCKTAEIDNIPQMLGKAIGQANKLVYQEAREYSDRGGMSSTVSVAVVYNQKLYVANVGDSRVYLVRGKEIRQLTVDHTWANEHIRSGRLTKERALNHPNADFLARSVGYEHKVKVDLGLYLKGETESGEDAFRNQGVPLGPNDLILVCSDGLIKERHDRIGHYAEEEEILRVMNSSTAEQAAKTLVDLALGRNVDDNVTAVVVEMPGRKRKIISRLPQISTAAVVALSVSLCAMAVFGFFSIKELVKKPEPTPIPGFVYVSSVSGESEKKEPGEDYRTFAKGDDIPFGEGSLVRITSGITQFNTPGNFRIYAIGDAQNPTIIEFFKDGDLTLEKDETIIRLLDGTIIVDKNEASTSNITFIVDTISGQAIINGTVMGNRFSSLSQVFNVDCFTGTCQMRSNVETYNLIGPEHSWLDASGNINDPDDIIYDYYGDLAWLFISPTDTPTPLPPEATQLTPTEEITQTPTNTPVPPKPTIPTPIPKRFTPTPNQYDRCGTLEAKGTPCP